MYELENIELPLYLKKTHNNIFMGKKGKKENAIKIPFSDFSPNLSY